jgi:hypothetical protein
MVSDKTTITQWVQRKRLTNRLIDIPRQQYLNIVDSFCLG